MTNKEYCALFAIASALSEFGGELVEFEKETQSNPEESEPRLLFDVYFLQAKDLMSLIRLRGFNVVSSEGNDA